MAHTGVRIPGRTSKSTGSRGRAARSRHPGHPASGRAAEASHQRLTWPVDRVADALASVRPLSGRSMSLPAAVQQPDAGAVADHVAGDADPGRPCPEDAHAHLELPRIRQHSACQPSVHDLRWHTLTMSAMREIPGECDNTEVLSPIWLWSARQGELGDRSADRAAIQRSMAGRIRRQHGPTAQASWRPCCATASSWSRRRCSGRSPATPSRSCFPSATRPRPS